MNPENAKDPHERELRRIKVLHHYSVLDTPPNAELDGLAALAAHVCGAPIALISLVDENRQWFKARIGMDLPQTPRAHSFCAHALDEPDIFMVPDAREDHRFVHNPLVTGEPGIRFYAGAPLKTPEEATLGTLCVIDRVPRELTPAQQWVLKILARQVVVKLSQTRIAGCNGQGEAGLLVPGVHPYSLEELRSLVCTNANRCAMWARLMGFLSWPVLTRQFSNAYISGNLIAQEPFPQSVDVVLESVEPYDASNLGALGCYLGIEPMQIADLYSVNLRFWVGNYPEIPPAHRSRFIPDLPSSFSDRPGEAVVRIDLHDSRIIEQYHSTIDPMNLLKVPRHQWTW
jgi:hypothetical protein